MAVVSISGSVTTSGDISFYPALKGNQLTVNYYLKTLKLDISGSGITSGEIDIKLWPPPDNQVTVEYFIQNVIKPEFSAVTSGTIENFRHYPDPVNSFTVEYYLKDLKINPTGSATTSGKINTKLWPVPDNQVTIDYFLQMPLTSMHGSAVTSGLIQPFPFGLEGSAITSGQARALRQLKTNLTGSITATSSIDGIMLKDYIIISGSAVTSGQIKALRQLKTNLTGGSTTLAEIIPPNQLRTDLIGRIDVNGQINPLLHRLTKLTGQVEANLDILFPENYYYYSTEINAGIDRTQKYSLFGDFGIERETLHSVDLNLGVERINLFKFQLIYSDSRVLGDVIYPYAAKNNMKELIIPKSYAEIETNAGNITFDWGMTLQDSRIIEEWDYMEEYFYEQLRDLFEANNGANIYDYQFNNTERYRVEIVDFDGQPYREGYYQNVSLVLKPLEKIIL